MLLMAQHTLCLRHSNKFRRLLDLHRDKVTKSPSLAGLGQTPKSFYTSTSQRKSNSQSDGVSIAPEIVPKRSGLALFIWGLESASYSVNKWVDLSLRVIQKSMVFTIVFV